MMVTSNKYFCDTFLKVDMNHRSCLEKKSSYFIKSIVKHATGSMKRSAEGKAGYYEMNDLMFTNSGNMKCVDNDRTLYM